MVASAAPGVTHRRLTQQEVDLICAKHDRLWSARMGGARAVFSFTDLSGLDMRGRNLCDADFSGAIMHQCKMAGARLDNAVLFGADLTEVDLVEASLRRADLRGACLRAANLTGADLFEADLREGAIAAADRKEGYKVMEHTLRTGAAQALSTNLVGANLERSRLSGIMAIKADFTDAVLKDAKLVRANLKQASMSGCNLAGADLSGADLRGADLRDAIMVGAKTFAWNATDANLTGVLTDPKEVKADHSSPYPQMVRDHARWCETGGAEGKPSLFDKADLRSLGSIRGFNLTALVAKGAIFYGLDMEGVQLQGAQLQGADLRSCNLRRADLRGAKLTGAKLSEADLRDAQLGPLLIGKDRVLPSDLSEAVLKSADLARADLRQAILRGADVSRANFTNAMVKDIDLTDVIRHGAKGLEGLI
ncbi:pentapeptide repeat-containing protein [Caulobacter sp. NIBR2454]|uniref:pentapeptide repeat-containing protein n=1 Tax=Caulobacter sp. NIBR2454 TaxID=3015996 RepID=UPI0022B63400|nr:pentapeptide repeat-containing protein [Caulobacter sp. NIBR2454]